MPEPLLDTVNLLGWLERLRAGDRAAKNELLRACQGRLEALARKMLKRYRVVIRWSDAEDVMSGASMRLLKALESTPVADTRGFFNLAAAIIRRELIDLARHFGGPLGLAPHHDSLPPRSDGPLGPDPAADETDPAHLDRWAALHEAIERLPPEEREVFGLTFYHRWTQQEIADLFQCSDKTVSRRLKDAARMLERELGGELPTE